MQVARGTQVKVVLGPTTLMYKVSNPRLAKIIRKTTEETRCIMQM
jgi:hypothetical protein